MKVIFSEGSIHHLKTMEMQTSPRVGEKVVVDNRCWIVTDVAHLPKDNGRNDNENMYSWDVDRDADLTVHLTDADEG